jgi:hypothetical protein
VSGWIKMGVGLRRHPKVVRLAAALKADRLRVVGALHAVWCVFDEHSNAGRLEGYSSSVMDEEIGWRGFSKAMQGIGWLVEDADGLTVPDYEEHNGPTAKRRAQDASRKGRSRAEADDQPDPDPQPVRIESGHASGQMSASEADTSRNREEKRREEKKNTPQTPKGEGRFPDFWAVWPTGDRKQDRKKCLAKWVRCAWDAEADAIVAHVVAMKATRQWRDGYEPAPLTYLNGERWRDGVPSPATASADDVFAGAH